MSARDGDEIDLQSIGILLADHVLRRTQTHPLSTVASVAGVGLVLGGGVPNALLRFGASVALRTLTTELLVAASRPASAATPATEVPQDDDSDDAAAE